MPAQNGTFDTIANFIAQLLRPLEDRLGAGEIRFLLAELGLDFPVSIETNSALTNATKSAVQRVRQLPGLVSSLAAAIEAEDIGQILAKSLDLADAAKTIIVESEKVGNTLKT